MRTKILQLGEAAGTALMLLMAAALWLYPLFRWLDWILFAQWADRVKVAAGCKPRGDEEKPWLTCWPWKKGG